MLGTGAGFMWSTNPADALAAAFTSSRTDLVKVIVLIGVGENLGAEVEFGLMIGRTVLSIIYPGSCKRD